VEALQVILCLSDSSQKHSLRPWLLDLVLCGRLIEVVEVEQRVGWGLCICKGRIRRRSR
jgi:hypothetical protein